MNELNSSADREEPGRRRESFTSMQPSQSFMNHEDRLAELENENFRLHRLVAELLIKNQQLRKQS
jgi:hypothetical protein